MNRTGKRQKSEYDVQAEEFCKKHSVEITSYYSGHRARLSEYVTSVWVVTISRPNRNPMTFEFSQSINDSWAWSEGHKVMTKPGLPPKLLIDRLKFPECRPESFSWRQYVVRPTRVAPTEYSILACLTKYDPGSFSNFCSEYGYGTDSRRALATYEAVRDEWEQVEHVFGDCLEELSEIS